MKPKFLTKVLPEEYISSPEWASDCYYFEDEEEWKKSINRCYTSVPTKILKRFKFVYMPDNDDQIGAKTVAAEEAFDYVMAQYDKIYDSDPKYNEHQKIFYSMMYHFFACLRTFHPLTMHLKVKDFNKSFASCNFYSCPFGKGAEKWRRHHGLKYLTGSMLNMQCQCNKPQ